jgi:hypothetical protein
MVNCLLISYAIKFQTKDETLNESFQNVRQTPGNDIFLYPIDNGKSDLHNYLSISNSSDDDDEMVRILQILDNTLLPDHIGIAHCNTYKDLRDIWGFVHTIPISVHMHGGKCLFGDL